MIFVTTGTQEPFDRLLKLISVFATSYNDEIIVQAKTNLIFSNNVKLKEFISPEEFSDYFSRADLVISHAGMGTIISALEIGKSLIIFPRIASLGEHRNEHQMATARKMKELGLVHVAFEESDLFELIDKHSNVKDSRCQTLINNFASQDLISSIDNFVNQ